jgi:hypothetical protein
MPEAARRAEAVAVAVAPGSLPGMTRGYASVDASPSSELPLRRAATPAGCRAKRSRLRGVGLLAFVACGALVCAAVTRAPPLRAVAIASLSGRPASFVFRDRAAPALAKLGEAGIYQPDWGEIDLGFDDAVANAPPFVAPQTHVRASSGAPPRPVERFPGDRPEDAWDFETRVRDAEDAARAEAYVDMRARRARDEERLATEDPGERSLATRDPDVVPWQEAANADAYLARVRDARRAERSRRRFEEGHYEEDLEFAADAEADVQRRRREKRYDDLSAAHTGDNRNNSPLGLLAEPLPGDAAGHLGLEERSRLEESRERAWDAPEDGFGEGVDGAFGGFVDDVDAYEASLTTETELDEYYRDSGVARGVMGADPTRRARLGDARRNALGEDYDYAETARPRRAAGTPGVPRASSRGDEADDGNDTNDGFGEWDESRPATLASSRERAEAEARRAGRRTEAEASAAAAAAAAALADYDYEAYADRGDPDLPATLPRGARIDAANVDGGVVLGGRASRGGAAAGMDPLDDGDGDGSGSESSRVAGVSSAAAFAPGVPGLASHAVRASGSTAPSTRVVLVSKPGEWPLAALQLASARANAPRVAPHVTALVFTRADLRRCEASRPRPDCFLDETFEARFPRDAELGAFLEGGGEGGGDDDWGGAEGVASIPMMTEEEAGRAEAAAGRGEAAAGVRASEVRAGPRQKLSPAALSFLDWRGAHAAHSLLAANVPAVVLGADAVFLRDPSASWRDAMRRFDVTVGSFVGDAEEAQRNADTSMVLAPATREARELVKLWLRGEGEAPSREAEESASENGLDSLFFTSGAYFNDVLAPTTAGHFRIHHAGARERANFVTARAGEAGDFDETSLVSAAFCRTAASKEGFLRRVLETEADARAVSEAEEAVISEAEFDEAVSENRFSPSVLSDDVSLDITEWNADDEPGLGRGRGLEDAGSSTGASRRTRRKESRRASRRTARALERAARRAKGLPLVTGADDATHAATVATRGGEGGTASSDASEAFAAGFPGSDRCDAKKRDAYFQGEYTVTQDRRVEWGARGG